MENLISWGWGTIPWFWSCCFNIAFSCWKMNELLKVSSPPTHTWSCSIWDERLSFSAVTPSFCFRLSTSLWLVFLVSARYSQALARIPPLDWACLPPCIKSCVERFPLISVLIDFCSNLRGVRRSVTIWYQLPQLHNPVVYIVTSSSLNLIMSCSPSSKI